MIDSLVKMPSGIWINPRRIAYIEVQPEFDSTTGLLIKTGRFTVDGVFDRQRRTLDTADSKGEAEALAEQLATRVSRGY